MSNELAFDMIVPPGGGGDMTGLETTAIIKGGGLIVDKAPDIIGVLGRLIGVPPRGDLQKFNRVMVPPMVRQASATGLPVDAFWFGDIVRVNADGTYGVSYQNVGTLASAREIWATQAKTAQFYTMECGSGLMDSSTAHCTFLLHGRKSILDGLFKTEAPTPSTAGVGSFVAIALLIGGFFVFRKIF
jgi:hypothetical protein